GPEPGSGCAGPATASPPRPDPGRAREVTRSVPVQAAPDQAHSRSAPGEPAASVISYSTVPSPRRTRRAPAFRSSAATATLLASVMAVGRANPFRPGRGGPPPPPPAP